MTLAAVDVCVVSADAHIIDAFAVLNAPVDGERSLFAAGAREPLVGLRLASGVGVHARTIQPEGDVVKRSVHDLSLVGAFEQMREIRDKLREVECPDVRVVSALSAAEAWVEAWEEVDRRMARDDQPKDGGDE